MPVPYAVAVIPAISLRITGAGSSTMIRSARQPANRTELPHKQNIHPPYQFATVRLISWREKLHSGTKHVNFSVITVDAHARPKWVARSAV